LLENEACRRVLTVDCKFLIFAKNQREYCGKEKNIFIHLHRQKQLTEHKEMKQNKKNDYSYIQTFEKFMKKVFCAFIFVEIPVLRLRRPILPRA
jgi:hypothetical protein